MLWKRVLPVLLARLKTNDQVPDAERAFEEARQLARLCGLDAEEYLARATAELPDPKSWAREEAALQAAGEGDSGDAEEGGESEEAEIDSVMAS